MATHDARVREDVLYGTQSGFLSPRPEDEELHDVDAPAPADPGASETSYLGFNVPEAGISCEIYHWFHPAFGLVSGGVMIFQGHHDRSAEGAYVDYRNFMRAPRSIAAVTYDTGVTVQVIEPLRELRVQFESPDGSTSFDVVLRAIMPPAGRADGLHFVQAMRATGELVLHGQRHVVDSFFTRDRTYRSPRPEISHPIGPTAWTAAVFGEDLAFHVVGSPGAALSAENLRWGYIWRDGELRRPVAMSMTVDRADDGVTPRSAAVELEDEHGERYRLRATSRTMLPMSFWPNMVTHLALCEWEYDGRTGHGDLQDIVFGQWLHQQRTTRQEIDA